MLAVSWFAMSCSVTSVLKFSSFFTSNYCNFLQQLRWWQQQTKPTCSQVMSKILTGGMEGVEMVGQQLLGWVVQEPVHGTFC